MKTGILWDDLFLKHDTGPAHPESKERLLSIRQGLESYPHLKELKRLGLRPATETELRLVHPAAYIRNIQRSTGKPFTYLDPDTAVCDASYEVAIHAVGGILQMIESLMSGEIDNGFAFVRPPGHHAEPERAMGFCLFSNVALGAAYALKRFRLQRVLVVDFDVHHGNGTQKTFYGRNDVLFISSHQFPLFPGTGAFPETGSASGQGFHPQLPPARRHRRCHLRPALRGDRPSGRQGLQAPIDAGVGRLRRLHGRSPGRYARHSGRIRLHRPPTQNPGGHGL